MQLQIRGGEETSAIEAQENETISQLKSRIGQLQGVSQEFNLYCSGSPLADDFLVGDLQNNVLELIVPLVGGKVHGSLARAGKVKAQTPKVDKKEKNKKKTGRAKRRIQYNRRFVNVVHTIGRKRGPNSNTNS